MIIEVEFLTLIIALVLVVLTAFLIPLILQLKRTAKQADELIEELRQELLPTLRESGEISQRVNHISEMVESSVDRFGALIEKAGLLLVGMQAASQAFSKNQKKGD